MAILDNDGHNRQPIHQGGLDLVYWRRYEAENYFVTPEVLRRYALEQYADMELFDAFQDEIDRVLGRLVLERVFDSAEADYRTYCSSAADVARLLGSKAVATETQ